MDHVGPDPGEAPRAPGDEELMRRVGEGDAAAFGRLVLRHQGPAFRLACRFTGDAAAAEDLAQEAFLRIFRAAPRYRPTATFRTYLHRVLSRLCLDHRRKKRPHPAHPLPEAPDGSSSPEVRAARSEREAFVQSALDALPADQRLAVALRYFEGLDGAEMAAAMGRSRKAVERILARARAALAPRLSGLAED